MKDIVLASNSPGKLREFKELVRDIINILPQSELKVPELEEAGLSFVENAILKARNASRHSGLAALADDSGLEVDVLGGAPGIYSARYAGPSASDRDNLERLLQALAGVPEDRRQARFHCALVYMEHEFDPTPLICQGTWEGGILFEPQGELGFGYDPVFYVPEYDCSAAELPAQIKNSLSHRGQALRNLCDALGRFG